jgi:hypothetical protein
VSTFDLDRLQAIWRSGATPGDADLPVLGDLRSFGARFPRDAVQGSRRALCLFCALFCGRSDVIYVHDAQPEYVTLVDSDAAAMATMRRLYPPHWIFWTGDYRDFLATAEPAHFDLVVADQPRLIGKDVVLAFLPMIARLCAPRFRFIANYWAETVAELGADADDLRALSRALSERSGIAVGFHEMMRRGPELHWGVIDVRVR